jgi:hypothetical protein
MSANFRGAKLALIAASAVALCIWPATAGAATVVNGTFETGNLDGWTPYNETGSSGTWTAYTGTTSPFSGYPIPAPPQGTYAAIADENSESSEILYQDIKLGRHQRHILSLYVYYNAYAPIAAPLSLSFTYPGSNEQYRVDVMKPAAAVTSVASSDILKTVFATPSGAPESMSPKVVTANLSSLAGQTVRLRFAMVARDFYMQAGTDEVMITSTPLVKTGKASSVKAHRATLHGRVNPNGGPTKFYFQYGKTRHYGKKTAVEQAGLGTTSEKEHAAIKGLKPSTTYHFRIVAKNAAAKSKGRDHTFTTRA